jgi:Histidine kinase
MPPRDDRGPMTDTAPTPAPVAARAALLSVVTTLYEIGAHFDFGRPAAAQALDIAGTWAAHFMVACSMLWLVERSFARARPAPLPGWRRIAVLVLACTGVGWMLHLGLLGVRTQAYADASIKWDYSAVVPFLGWWNLCLAVLLTLTQAATVRSRVAIEALHATQLSQVRLEQEMAAARTQLLQAQVEPHFLFNALANVRRLLHIDPPAARILLGDLLRYLEEALPALREETTTLGREAGLVRAFLAVHQVRMGPRLRFQVDLPPALAALPVPPMVLLTLVENALKHGLQPTVDGGSVQVSARREGGSLVLSVADTGRGMGSGSGQGTGLANVRARLKSMYGAAASLSLALNEPRGVVATVRLPVPS